MKPLALCVASLAVGGAGGFGVARWTATPTEPMPVAVVPTAGMGEVALSETQMDAFADRMAAAVARRLAPMITARAPGATPADERAREAAFARATQIVDMMIASRRITRDGLNEAEVLLHETGQANRNYELHARIAAAVNRRELTPEQAGWGQLEH